MKETTQEFKVTLLGILGVTVVGAIGVRFGNLIFDKFVAPKITKK